MPARTQAQLLAAARSADYGQARENLLVDLVETLFASKIVNATGALAVTKDAHDGKIVTLNAAAGQAVTLPAATGSGLDVEFVIGTTITSNATTIKVTGDDTMTGQAVLAQDGGDTSVMFEAAADADTISFNGSTKGGLKGARVRCVDVAANLWYVSVQSAATSTEETPFSATVS